MRYLPGATSANPSPPSGVDRLRRRTVAAVTTALPERAEAGRNYDYRYGWIRDICYTGHAGAAVEGGEAVLDDAVRWVGARLLRTETPRRRRTGVTAVLSQNPFPSGCPAIPAAPTSSAIGSEISFSSISSARSSSFGERRLARPPRCRWLGRRRIGRPRHRRARRREGARDLGDRAGSLDTQQAHLRRRSAGQSPSTPRRRGTSPGPCH